MSDEPFGRGVEEQAPAVSVDLPADNDAPAGARRALEPLRDALPPPEFVDVRLLVSELVVDELRCREERGGSIHLVARVEGGTLRIELVEGWKPTADVPQRPRPGEPGWGIYLAQLLGDRWGADPDGDRTRIWIEKRVSLSS